MDIRTKKLNGFITLSMLIIACLIMTSVLTFFTQNYANAFKLVSDGDNGEKIPDDQATNLGEMLCEGYENGGKIFDDNIFWSLITQITGVANPSKETVNDVNLGATPKTAQNFRDLNGGKDVVVEIGGKRWTATYLSRSKTEDNPDGDPILTLWLATTEDHKEGRVNYGLNNEAGEHPGNLYGTSKIRSVTLNNGGSYANTSASLPLVDSARQDENSEWAIFTMSDALGSISDFIEVPNNMPWQHNQQSSKVTGAYAYDNNNDALDIGGLFPSSYLDKTGYKAWCNDKLWLPSYAELGANSSVAGLWSTSLNQRADDGDVNYLTRSAYSTETAVWAIAPSGGSGSYAYNAWESYSYRPAFHLNLSLVAGEGLASPKDVEVFYNGDEQSVDSSNASWFDPSRMRIDYFGVAPKDAKEYTLKAIITTDDEFRGTPDLSKGENENNKERVFKFIIKKKEITIDIEEQEEGGGLVVTPNGVYSGDERAPIFEIKYTGGNDGNYNSSNYPTAKGSYTATVSISNPDNCNYVLTGTVTKTITITAREVAKPTVGDRTKGYNAREQSFSVSGITNANDIIITPPSGMRYDATEKKLYATDANTYNVTVALADRTNTKWATTDGGGNDDFTISITISKANLTLEFISEGGWSWNSGTEKVVSFTDTRKDGDEVYFTVKYDNTPIGNVNTVTASKTTTVTIPELEAREQNYILSVTLDTTTGAGKNYTLSGQTTRSFTVTDREIEVEQSNIIWSYSANDGEPTELASWSPDTVFELTYANVTYTFFAKVDGLEDDDVTVTIDRYDNQTGRTVGDYQTIVHLTSADGTLTNSSFTLKWKIKQGKYDLSNVKWNYNDNDPFRYDGTTYYKVQLQNLPTGLSVTTSDYAGDIEKKNVSDSYRASVVKLTNSDSNYITPNKNNPSTYICQERNEQGASVDKDFPWTLNWKIVKGNLRLSWTEEIRVDEESESTFKLPQIIVSQSSYIDGYKYYKDDLGEKGEEISVDDITVGDGAVFYWVEAILKSNVASNYNVEEETTAQRFQVGSDNEEVRIELSRNEYSCDGNSHGIELSVRDANFDISRLTFTYYKDSVSEENKLSGAPSEIGNYIIVIEMRESDQERYYLSREQISFSIVERSSANDPTSPDDPNAGDSNNPNNSGNSNDPNGDGNGDGQGGDNNDSVFDELLEKIKDLPLWQLIVCMISIILIIIFTSKGIGYENKRKKTQKTIEKKYNTYYAIALLGLSPKTWTALACILLGVTILAFIFMLLAKNRYGKVLDDLDYAKDEYEKNQKEAENKRRDEQMQMMLMGMFGGNGQGGQGLAYQQGLGAEDIRGIVADTMNNMLPNMTQYLPQPASNNNDELVRKLEEQNEQNEKRIKKLADQNEKTMEKMMKQLAEVQSAEKAVASANVNDEVLSDLQTSIKEMQKQIKNVAKDNNFSDDMLDKLAVRLKPVASDDRILQVVEKTEHNDEAIRQLLRNQVDIMDKLKELSNAKTVEPQVIEKIVEVPVEVEKVVEVPIEKIVEKEVVKEVPVEVEKVVEKIVKIPAEKHTSKTTRTTAPRLNINEAYDNLSAKQKKIFDTLKSYAMSKDKCKEKKSTYFIVLGQSTVNPLVKLTIKKNTTVALFKMEDEYFKDIRRNAGSDGTKMKIKETELVVGDMQALSTAKEMIDLREDQIERYNEYLREQRSMKRR